MAEKKGLKEFFEFVVAGETARLVLEGVGKMALGPVGIAIPLASRAIEFYGPVVIRRVWLFLSEKTKAEAAGFCEELANLDAKTAWQEANEAFTRNTKLNGASEDEKKVVGAVVAAVPAGLRQMLPRDNSGRSTCPLDMLPGSEAELARIMPLAIPPYLPPCELPGTPYFLDEIAGTGGFGTVYRAHLKTEYEPRAIKVPSDPSRINSLRKEKENLERLVSNGAAWSNRVVRLYGHQLEQEPIFLIYEFIKGGDLSKYVIELGRSRQGSLSPDDILKLIRAFAECLAVPHNAGIAHRDLKPSNLLYDNDGWKLADFGLGAMATNNSMHTEGRSSVSLSQELRGSGTHLYMCEEQRSGDKADPRHDIYSLGVVWFQLLLGNFTRRLTLDWDELLRGRSVPDEHIALIGKCLRGIKTRPLNGSELCLLIDSIGKERIQEQERAEVERLERKQKRVAQRKNLQNNIISVLHDNAKLILASAALGILAGGACSWTNYKAREYATSQITDTNNLFYSWSHHQPIFSESFISCLYCVSLILAIRTVTMVIFCDSDKKDVALLSGLFGILGGVVSSFVGSMSNYFFGGISAGIAAGILIGPLYAVYIWKNADFLYYEAAGKTYSVKKGRVNVITAAEGIGYSSGAFTVGSLAGSIGCASVTGSVVFPLLCGWFIGGILAWFLAILFSPND